MCRLMAFIGERPMLLADLILWPDRYACSQGVLTPHRGPRREADGVSCMGDLGVRSMCSVHARITS